MKSEKFVPYNGPSFEEEEMKERVSAFRAYMDKRRSVREFSDRPLSESLIEDLIMTASSAPSGANKQPWIFCVVSDPEIKSKIRKAAEEEEYENYHGRMSEEWMEDLKKFGTDWHKEFLEISPVLIIVFKKAYDVNEDGSKSKNYYVNESVGLATGFLLTAIHQAGLVSLTHTPSPMNFLQKILNRPSNERPFLLIPVGYPKEGAQVPDITKKSAEEVIERF